MFDPATAKEGELLVEQRRRRRRRGLSYSRKRKVLTNATWVTWKTERKFFDKETEEMWKDVEAKLPGYEIAFTSANRDEDKFIVAAFSDKTRGKRYLYDKATQEA